MHCNEILSQLSELYAKSNFSTMCHVIEQCYVQQ